MGKCKFHSQLLFYLTNIFTDAFYFYFVIISLFKRKREKNLLSLDNVLKIRITGFLLTFSQKSPTSSYFLFIC